MNTGSGSDFMPPKHIVVMATKKKGGLYARRKARRGDRPKIAK